jgi:hypothetical protein
VMMTVTTMTTMMLSVSWYKIRNYTILFIWIFFPIWATSFQWWPTDKAVIVYYVTSIISKIKFHMMTDDRTILWTQLKTNSKKCESLT